MTRPRDSYEFVYVHTDIPDGMTIREWRGQVPSSGKPSAGKSVRPAASA